MCARFVISLVGLFLFWVLDCEAQENAAATAGIEAVAERLKEIESQLGGRLGVSAWEADTEKRIGYRTEERFAMCSTFKLLLTAAVLHRVEKGEEQMDRAIAYREADLLEHAPIAREHVAEGAMTIEALCAAVMGSSDNTAANLLLATIGGPAGFTAYVRSLGDEMTRLDRKEPELNTAIPGDPRDTTSPAAMLASMRTVLLGKALTTESRAQAGRMDGREYDGRSHDPRGRSGRVAGRRQDGARRKCEHERHRYDSSADRRADLALRLFDGRKGAGQGTGSCDRGNNALSLRGVGEVRRLPH